MSARINQHLIDKVQSQCSRCVDWLETQAPQYSRLRRMRLILRVRGRTLTFVFPLKFYLFHDNWFYFPQCNSICKIVTRRPNTSLRNSNWDVRYHVYYVDSPTPTRCIDGYSPCLECLCNIAQTNIHTGICCSLCFSFRAVKPCISYTWCRSRQ